MKDACIPLDEESTATMANRHLERIPAISLAWNPHFSLRGTSLRVFSNLKVPTKLNIEE